MMNEITKKNQLIENKFYWLVYKKTGDYCALKYRLDSNAPKYSFKASCELYNSIFDSYFIYGPIDVPLEILNERRRDLFGETEEEKKAKSEQTDVATRLDSICAEISKIKLAIARLREQQKEPKANTDLGSLSRQIEIGQAALSKKIAEYAEVEGLYKELEVLLESKNLDKPN